MLSQNHRSRARCAAGLPPTSTAHPARTLPPVPAAPRQASATAAATPPRGCALQSHAVATATGTQLVAARCTPGASVAMPAASTPRLPRSSRLAHRPVWQRRLRLPPRIQQRPMRGPVRLATSALHRQIYVQPARIRSLAPHQMRCHCRPATCHLHTLTQGSQRLPQRLAAAPCCQSQSQRLRHSMLPQAAARRVPGGAAHC